MLKQKRSGTGLGLLVSVALLGGVGAGSAVAQTGAGAAREALERDFPDVVLIEREERVRTVLGRPMTTGATPREAMEDWLLLYGDVFGVDELEWVEAALPRSAAGAWRLRCRRK